MTLCFSVLLLALVNCDVGRQNGHTDDDDRVVDAGQNKSANTKTDDQIETNPHANVTTGNVSSVRK